MTLLDPAATVASGVETLHEAIDQLQRPELALAPADGTIAEIDRAIRRLESVKLRVVAAAERASVARESGLASTESWLARRTQSNPAQAAADCRLATALETDPTSEPRPCAEALANGAISSAHAHVITRATDQLPAELPEGAVQTIEARLVERAQHVSPEQLRRLARRALAAVEPDESVVDQHHEQVLRSEEEAALARTRLTWHDNGDGTTSGHFTVPTFAAGVLTRIIQSMTAPRRARLGATDAQAGPIAERRDWAHAAGLAFVELLEHLPTDHLHRKVAATVVVTMSWEKLLGAAGAAQLDLGDQISASDARRLACGAGVLPAVLSGPSLPLDLGRSSRLFTEAQSVALATRHTSCAADGCDRPYSWCELHHREPWAHGGPTDLENAVPLCGFHHRRIHDPAYLHEFSPDGVRFRLR